MRMTAAVLEECCWRRERRRRARKRRRRATARRRWPARRCATQGTATLRYTVWYPAQAGSRENALTIGPPDAPLFDAGRSAGCAGRGDRLPTLLLAWQRRQRAHDGLARAGAGRISGDWVDHPGNNGVDTMTLPGSLLTWLRADDLRAALAAVQADPVLGPHVDPERLGSPAFGRWLHRAAGSRCATDLQRLRDFCTAHPDDGVCRPNRRRQRTRWRRALPLRRRPSCHHGCPTPTTHAPFPACACLLAGNRAGLCARAALLAETAGVDRTGPGGHDRATTDHGEAARAVIAAAALQVLPGVGHYDFLAACTRPDNRGCRTCAAHRCRRRRPTRRQRTRQYGSSTIRVAAAGHRPALQWARPRRIDHAPAAPHSAGIRRRFRGHIFPRCCSSAWSATMCIGWSTLELRLRRGVRWVACIWPSTCRTTASARQ